MALADRSASKDPAETQENDTQVVAGVYICELKLLSHAHRLEGEQKEQLDSIIEDLQELRFDLQPTHFFGDME